MGAQTALRESSLQIHSQRMELYQANQSSDHSRREKDWLYGDLEERERALPETRMKFLQEMEELKKCRCTEAERGQQLRIDELSR